MVPGLRRCLMVVKYVDKVLPYPNFVSCEKASPSLRQCLTDASLHPPHRTLTRSVDYSTSDPLVFVLSHDPLVYYFRLRDVLVCLLR